MKVPAIVTPKGVTVFANGKTYIANKEHPNYSEITAVLQGKYPGLTADNPSSIKYLVDLFDIPKAITVKSGGKVQIVNGEVVYDGKPVHSTLTRRMLELLADGFNVDPMIKFMEKLFNNPSFRAVQCLYDFLEANNIPLTPEGNFLTFKKVRSDYYDYYSGKYRNMPGDEVSEDRNQVDEDPNVTCSRGLHVCAEHYLPYYHGGSGRVVICEVNPANVVAVPKDYNNAKMRVCFYKVVGEVPEASAAKYFHSSVIDPSAGFSLREDADDSADYYSADEFLDYDGQIVVEEPDVRVTVNIAGQDVVFERQDGGWDASFTGEDGVDTTYFSYEDDLECAIDEFKGDVVEERATYVFDLIALDDDGKVIEDTITVSLDPYDDGEYEAFELFADKHDVDHSDIRVRSKSALGTKEVLVW